jgi:hypothetical protein
VALTDYAYLLTALEGAAFALFLTAAGRVWNCVARGRRTGAAVAQMARPLGRLGPRCSTAGAHPASEGPDSDQSVPLPLSPGRR